jgi:hypothetical protein
VITKFSVLHAGQIELDNVGLHGTPANERRYPNERPAETGLLVREKRDARLRGPAVAVRDTPGGIPPPGSRPLVGAPLGVVFFACAPS